MTTDQSDQTDDHYADDIERVTLNLTGDEAITLIDAVDHLTKTSNGELLEHYESIHDKLKRSLSTESD